MKFNLKSIPASIRLLLMGGAILVVAQYVPWGVFGDMGGMLQAGLTLGAIFGILKGLDNMGKEKKK